MPEKLGAGSELAFDGDSNASSRVDRAGVLTSCMCAAHCVAGALATTAAGSFSLAGAVLASDTLEGGLVVVAAVLALASVAATDARHRSGVMLLLPGAGLLLLVLARWVVVDHQLELLSSVLGVLALTAYHLWNARRARQHRAAAPGFERHSMADVTARRFG